MPETYDVFISYSRADGNTVRRLAENLRNAGLRVFFDDWEIGGWDAGGGAFAQGLERPPRPPVPRHRRLVFFPGPAHLRSAAHPGRHRQPRRAERPRRVAGHGARVPRRR
ncbi:MAG: toll/interleukin-1 receptor domain-containing protein [Acidobacteria bacterium]|nr:toll/interleukin-1 receptor domain-containing protein [Acidobacteriota bacterium]